MISDLNLISSVELLYLGREYPLGYVFFRDSAHRAFAQKADLQSEAEIQNAIDRAKYVKKEVETL